MLLVCYPSKKSLKEAVGQTLNYQETSMFGPEFEANGKLSVAYRPTVWEHSKGGREFFAVVTMKNGYIDKVV